MRHLEAGKEGCWKIVISWLHATSSGIWGGLYAEMTGTLNDNKTRWISMWKYCSHFGKCYEWVLYSSELLLQQACSHCSGEDSLRVSHWACVLHQWHFIRHSSPWPRLRPLSFPSARDLRLLMTDKQIIIPHGPYFRCCALLVGPVDHGQLKSRVLCHFKCITLLLGAPNFASVFALSWKLSTNQLSFAVTDKFNQWISSRLNSLVTCW